MSQHTHTAKWLYINTCCVIKERLVIHVVIFHMNTSALCIENDSNELKEKFNKNSSTININNFYTCVCNKLYILIVYLVYSLPIQKKKIIIANMFYTLYRFELTMLNFCNIKSCSAIRNVYMPFKNELKNLTQCSNCQSL